MALDKSEVSAKGKLLLGGALESALETSCAENTTTTLSTERRLLFPVGRIEIGKTHTAELLTESSASSGNTNA